MDANQLEQYKNVLQAEKEKHEQRIDALNSDKTRQKGAISADSSEAAQDIENDEVVDGLEELEINQLNMINAALVRIENGTYGTCVSCGEEISPARLKAVPSTPNCINCSN